MTSTLAQTPLHDWHASHGGRMVDFAGWSMPVQYGSIVAEHQATRRAAGLFDVSHMGRLWITGPDAAQFLDSLVTRRVIDMPAGQARYALVTNDSGGILDDVLVYRFAGNGSDPYHLMVVNASNREKISAWIRERVCEADVTVEDKTHAVAMIAVQGPLAAELVAPLVDFDLSQLSYYHAVEGEISGAAGIISRTGYTGEDGFELMLPADAAVSLWAKLLQQGEAQGVIAAGLGARDTLRLEAGMPLYGHELSEQITPLQAGLNFAIDLEGRTFSGREVLTKMKQAGVAVKRIGLELPGRRVPREGYPVLVGDRVVGHITSGTFSPTLDRPLAMAYVQADVAKVGTALSVDVRGTQEAAQVVKLPFYRRSAAAADRQVAAS